MASKAVRVSVKERRDESIMNTNNSCIVSKRSVEKLYHKSDHGLRHFVKKFHRRSPLINLGYWLRMRAIEQAIVSFLIEDFPAPPKAIVNLGCGYDTIAFKLLSERADLCKDAVFVDVDYPELIRKKCAVIRSTAQLSDSIGLVEGLMSRDDDVPLRTKHYVAANCDLTDSGKLNEIFKTKLGLQDRSVLFVAEVSMTYMDVEAADKVIAWASTFRDGQFCLLEQCLPDGPDTPFATTMLKHFNKLQSPLKSILHYPRSIDQEIRFVNQGWKTASARSLWDVWNDESCLSADEAVSITQIEPFDEWEEFALFANHYFVLMASTKSSTYEATHLPPEVKSTIPQLPITFEPHPQSHGQRRYGAAFQQGHSIILHQGGHGTQGRLSSADAFSSLDPEDIPPQHAWISKELNPHLPELMCHTITSLDSDCHLLVGGRTSPERASARCYLKTKETWTRAADLPSARYRHCALKVRSSLDNGNVAILVYGGKSNSGEVLGDFLLWRLGHGWESVKVEGPSPPSRFGASMCSWGDSGYLCGGMTRRGHILDDLWSWSASSDSHGAVSVSCTNMRHKLQMKPEIAPVFGRFGAVMVSTSVGIFLVGGVGRTAVPSEHDLLKIDQRLTVTGFEWPQNVPRPLLVGHAAVVMHVDGLETLVILGGGAVCFSFGTFWNQGCWAISTISGECQPKSLTMLQSRQPASEAQSGKITASDIPIRHEKRLQDHHPAEVQRRQSISASEFDVLLASAQPAVLTELDLGVCLQSWTAEYLTAKIGPERQVVVHDSPTPSMDFLAKNFSYTTIAFGDFITRMQSGAHLYLRSLSASTPATRPTHLHEDFPTLAKDFSLPPSLGIVDRTAHSSPLRISGRVTIWLHYDVRANIYAQIQGRKRLTLFPPSAVASLRFPPGASTSPLQVFDADGAIRAELRHLQPRIADLRPGDVLFIPPCWPHAAFSPETFGVAVNVFFADPALVKAYPSGKDVYGNRDLAAYETGRRDIARIVKGFKDVPRAVAGFYLQRLGAELQAQVEAEAEEVGTGN